MKNLLIEIIREALDESKETLTDRSIENIADWIEQLYENRELVTGPVADPRISEICDLKKKLEKEKSKTICKECNGSGRSKYNTDFKYPENCWTCKGEGRI